MSRSPSFRDFEQYGFYRIGAASLPVIPANPQANAEFIYKAMVEAEARGVRLLVLPELCLTGYTCADLFQQKTLQEETEKALQTLLEHTASFSLIAVVGLPLPMENSLYNAAAVICGGHIWGIVPKQYLPNYREFYEERWFTSGKVTQGAKVRLGGWSGKRRRGKGTSDKGNRGKMEGWVDVPFGWDLVFSLKDNPTFTFGIEICEDLWAVHPPSEDLARSGAVILCNLSASNEVVGKHAYRRDLIRVQSGRCVAAYVYAGSGVTESTTDLVFGGSTFIAENGVMLAEGPRFARTLHLTAVEVDLDRLWAERRTLTPFMDGGEPPGISLKDPDSHRLQESYRRIEIEIPKKGMFSFLRQQWIRKRALQEAQVLTGGTQTSGAVTTHPTSGVPSSLGSQVIQGTRASENAIATPLSQVAFNPSTFSRWIDPHPFVPANPEERDERCEEIFSIQTAGLAKRIEHTKSNVAVLGISGGLDSTLALLVTIRTFDLLHLPRTQVLAVTMPGFGTTDTTYQNACKLISSLGVKSLEIDIRSACLQHFQDLGHDPEVHDTTYENVQARERTQILMDLANKYGGIVVGTGDLSELALGWCTYNGDHMSMYGVNSGIPKTLVRYLVQWVADHLAEEESKNVLYQILATPITPELLPPDAEGKIRQKTEELIGPYELHDFFLYHFLRYGAPPEKIAFLAQKAFGGKYMGSQIEEWLGVFLRRFFSQQFKRSCLPDGPKVGSINLSPRG
ncbi:MAG: NAD(+) synthase, partial [Spirochaetales bacterium]